MKTDQATFPVWEESQGLSELLRAVQRWKRLPSERGFYGLFRASTLNLLPFIVMWKTPDWPDIFYCLLF